MEIRQVKPQDADALARFFKLLKARGVDKFFHPHPFTPELANERASYRGKDLYFILFEDSEVLGYGMLRGWDEGYEIPSLGIVIHPDAQGQGKGRLLMNTLRAAAQQRGAKKIRLRVYPENLSAVNLYRSLGYDFVQEKSGPYLVGFLDLVRN